MKRTCEYCGKIGEPEEACDCPERVACAKAGEGGHTMCGVCPTCNVPRFTGCCCNGCRCGGTLPPCNGGKT